MNKQLTLEEINKAKLNKVLSLTLSLGITTFMSGCSIIDTLSCGTNIIKPFATAADVRDVTIKFKTQDEAWKWVSDNIKYSNANAPTWQAPQDTIDRGTGACRDYAVLLGTLFRNMGIGCRVAIVDAEVWKQYNPKAEIIPNSRHAILQMTDGSYIEPQRFGIRYKVAQSQFFFSLTIDEILTVCAVNGSRDLKDQVQLPETD
jgi:hypothetical protein